jgi:uncharacterized membrane protein HdeD (DUF308 family)
MSEPIVTLLPGLAMTRLFAWRWGRALLRASAMLAFGGVVVLRPRLAVTLFLGLFIAYAALDGATLIAAALRPAEGLPRRWWLLGAGVESLVAVAVIALAPTVRSHGLATILGLWAVTRGMLEIGDALTAGRALGQAWALASRGVVPLGFGLMLLTLPGVSSRQIVSLIGAWMLALGALGVAEALQLRRADISSQALAANSPAATRH